jgi:hypothetical protein
MIWTLLFDGFLENPIVGVGVEGLRDRSVAYISYGVFTEAQAIMFLGRDGIAGVFFIIGMFSLLFSAIRADNNIGASVVLVYIYHLFSYSSFLAPMSFLFAIACALFPGIDLRYAAISSSPKREDSFIESGRRRLSRGTPTVMGSGR